jgi:hypothetical protein
MTYRDEIDVDDIVDEMDVQTGRPREYTFAIAQAICDNVQIGMTFKDAANLAGVKEKTAGAWKKRHSDFATAYAHAKLARKQSLIATVRVAAKNDWRAALAMLQQMYPEEWARQKILAIAKQTDKAAELIALVFSEAENFEELPEGELPNMSDGAQKLQNELGLNHEYIDVTPTPSDDNPGTPDDPDAE